VIASAVAAPKFAPRERSKWVKQFGLPIHAIALFITSSWAAERSQLPPAPIMAGAQVASVAESMRINGTPTSIRSFKVDKPLAEALSFYRETFGSRRVENEVLGWEVVSQRSGDFLYTVRLRKVSSSMTEGTASVADLKLGMAARDRPRGIAAPAESRFVTDLDMDDPGKRARLVLLNNAHSIETNADFFKRELTGKGYTLERELTAAGPGPTGRSLWFGGDRGKEAIVVISGGAGRTTVSLNFVDNTVQGR
jgi:hypothetical protein